MCCVHSEAACRQGPCALAVWISSMSRAISSVGATVVIILRATSVIAHDCAPGVCATALAVADPRSSFSFSHVCVECTGHDRVAGGDVGDGGHRGLLKGGPCEGQGQLTRIRRRHRSTDTYQRFSLENLPPTQGFRMIFTAPSCFFWKMSYACGACSSGSSWVANESTPSGSSSPSRGRMSGTHFLTLA